MNSLTEKGRESKNKLIQLSCLGFAIGTILDVNI